MNERNVPVFKGATRLPTFAGVPRTVLLFTSIFCGVLFMIIHMYAIFIFAILFAVEWSITKHDDKMFHVLFLFSKTTLPGRFSEFWTCWNGASDSPIVCEKPQKFKVMERFSVMDDIKKVEKGLSSLSRKE